MCRACWRRTLNVAYSPLKCRLLSCDNKIGNTWSRATASSTLSFSVLLKRISRHYLFAVYVKNKNVNINNYYTTVRFIRYFTCYPSTLHRLINIRIFEFKPQIPDRITHFSILLMQCPEMNRYSDRKNRKIKRHRLGRAEIAEFALVTRKGREWTKRRETYARRHSFGIRLQNTHAHSQSAIAGFAFIDDIDTCSPSAYLASQRIVSSAFYFLFFSPPSSSSCVLRETRFAPMCSKGSYFAHTRSSLNSTVR